MKDFVMKLLKKENLSKDDIKIIVRAIENNDFEAIQMAALLTALEAKGVTSDELYYFVSNIIEKAIIVDLGEDCIDVCGTGGDRKDTFNISTAAMFVIAGAGVKVAKHGNVAVSSSSGSYDVLMELGVKTDLGTEKAKEVIDKTGMAFLFAKKHHPIFKYVGAVRKGLGIKTIFNMMGPLLNPAKVKMQLMGVFDPAVEGLIAEVMKKKGIKKAMVVNGDGLDEITITGKTKITELSDGNIKSYEFDPKKYGFEYGCINDLKANSAEESAAIIVKILNGEKGKARDIVVLNAAAGLIIAGKAKDFKEGIELAEKSIDSREALEKLNVLKEITNDYFG